MYGKESMDRKGFGAEVRLIWNEGKVRGNSETKDNISYKR